jgi:hypothetical protein
MKPRLIGFLVIRSLLAIARRRRHDKEDELESHGVRRMLSGQSLAFVALALAGPMWRLAREQHGVAQGAPMTSRGRTTQP